MGEILMANQHAIRRGATTVTLPDYAGGPEASLTIPLEPSLPVRANAEAYFKRTAKARRGLPILRARLQETEESLKRLAEAEAKLGREPLPPKEEEALRRSIAPRGGAGPVATARQRVVEGPAPRHFLSSEGREILVGKSSQGNETLTFRLARSHDLWLHAQAIGGSHVLVRTEKAHPEVPARTLREAAVLAAYYSKARGQTKVAVDYTAARYVRKSKGGKVGEALITREKTIVVRPDPALVKTLAERARAGET
jgi:predicted ribosome quality control (RQC) complex YloA/Tae2 family protein